MDFEFDPVKGCDDCAWLTTTNDTPTICDECYNDQIADIYKGLEKWIGKD